MCHYREGWWREMCSKKQFLGSEPKRQSILSELFPSRDAAGWGWGWLPACPGVPLVCCVCSKWDRDRGYGHPEAKAKSKQERNPAGDLPEPPQHRRKCQIKTCVWSCCLPYQPSHELNHVQNKPSAAGAGWGFYSSPGKRRNKSPKVAAASSCRSGHMGTVWSSSSPGTTLVSACDPVLERAFVSCFSFQSHIPGEKKKN